jgi:hypothetical protein
MYAGKKQELFPPFGFPSRSLGTRKKPAVPKCNLGTRKGRFFAALRMTKYQNDKIMVAAGLSLRRKRWKEHAG